MNVTQTDGLEQVSMWLEDLRKEMQDGLDQLQSTDPDKFCMGFTVKGCRIILHNIEQAQKRLKYAGVPVAAQPLDKVYEGPEYGVKREGG